MGSSYDRLTQLILLALAEESPRTTSEILEETGADTNQAVHYRCKNKLIPSGLVARANDPQKGRASKYALTADGSTYVALLKRDLETPETETEALEMAQEALETAKQAKKSADTTAGKFRALKDKTDDTLEEANEAFGRAYDVEQNAVRKAKKKMKRELKDFAEGIDEDVVHPFKEIEEEFHERGDKMDEILEQQEEILERLDELESVDSDQYATCSEVASVASDVHSIQNTLYDINPNGLDVEIKNIHSRIDENEGKLKTKPIRWLIPFSERGHARKVRR
jgi:DNA-binding PadR family transcriptional regulator